MTWLPRWDVVVATLLVVAVGLYVGWEYSNWPPEPPASTTTSTPSSPSSSQPTSPPTTPAASDDAVQAIIVGDSHFENKGEGEPSVAERVGSEMEWDVTSFVSAGSGYVSKGAQTQQSFTDHVEDIVAAEPDLVLIEGGADDADAGAKKVDDALSGMLEELRDALPEAELIVLGPVFSGTPGDKGKAVAEAIAQAALSVPEVTYIDPVAGEWFTGQLGASSGPGREYVGPDGLRLNSDGRDRLVELTVDALQGAGVSTGSE